MYTFFRIYGWFAYAYHGWYVLYIILDVCIIHPLACITNPIGMWQYFLSPILGHFSHLSII
jgi:hypothetical protein